MKNITKKEAVVIIKQYEIKKIEDSEEMESCLTDVIPGRPYNLPEECRNGGCWFYIKSCPPGDDSFIQFHSDFKDQGENCV